MAMLVYQRVSSQPTHSPGSGVSCANGITKTHESFTDSSDQQRCESTKKDLQRSRALQNETSISRRCFLGGLKLEVHRSFSRGTCDVGDQLLQGDGSLDQMESRESFSISLPGETNPGGFLDDVSESLGGSDQNLWMYQIANDPFSSRLLKMMIFLLTSPFGGILLVLVPWEMFEF